MTKSVTPVLETSLNEGDLIECATDIDNSANGNINCNVYTVCLHCLGKVVGVGVGDSGAQPLGLIG